MTGRPPRQSVAERISQLDLNGNMFEPFFPELLVKTLLDAALCSYQLTQRAD